MQEQNFEQQVRQKMDELSLVPSAPVWNKVEEEIRKKKDRKRIVLWLLPLALLSAGIIWWSVSTNKLDSTITSQKTEPANATISNEDAKGRNETSIPIEIKKEKVQSKEPEIITETNTPGLKKTPQASNSITTKTKNVEKKIASKKLHHTKKIDQNIFLTNTPVLQKEKLQQNPTKNNQANRLIAPVANNSLVITKNQAIKEIVSQTNSKPRDTPKVSEQMDTKKLQFKKMNKLQFAVTGQVGFSGITSGLFDGFGAKSAEDFSSPIQNGSGGGIITLPPSKIKQGLFYSLGLSLQKKLTSRSTISSGLQYQYYSTSINVGTRADSVFGNASSADFSYYRNDTQSNDYTNRFHFITLPIAYQYQLLKKVPLQIGAGISISQLISSNALHYNSRSNIYYKDNELLNKTQVSFFTNVSYKLWKQKGFSLDVGPQLNYNLTPLQKNSNSNKQHLFSIGLNTQVKF